MTFSRGHAPAAQQVVLYPPASLGVLGSGQLGRMFIQAAQRMGYRAGVLAAREDDPAAQVANWTVIGSSGELRALRSFATRADAVTVEFENVAAHGLRWLARSRVGAPGLANCLDLPEPPSRENSFLPGPACRTRPGTRCAAIPSLRRALEVLGLPLILKTASSGYDGKGQILVRTPGDAAGAWASLGRAQCVAEALVEFAAELSVVVARGADGRAVCYPVALNRHCAPHSRRHLHAGERRARGHPAGAAAGAGGGPGAGHDWCRDGRVLSVRGRAPPGQRDCAPAAQLGTFDDRSQRHQPVRAAGARLVRIAAGPDRPDHAGGNGQPPG